MPFLLSLDCGLTVCKAAVFDEGGKKLCECREETPAAGWRMDPEALWAKAAKCISNALAASKVPAARIAALGLSGHGNGLYALDSQGKCFLAISPMFHENRTDVDAFRESAAYPPYFQAVSQSCWGGQPLQIARWLKKNQPETYAKIRHILLCKDYLRYRLTGELKTDESDFSAGALCENPAFYDLMGVPEMARAAPAAVRCDEISGRVSAGAAAQTGLMAGTPVAGGGIDMFCCMQGAGVTDASRASITMGTWGITISYAKAPLCLEPLTQSCAFLPGWPTAAIVSAPTSCVNLEWFLRNVRPGLSLDAANEVALAFAPGDVSLLYLPYLYPDMAYPDADCGFIGLTGQDTWREMLRAVYEGVCFAHRLQWERLGRAGIRLDRARLSGGATHSEAWCRLMSDIVGITLEIPAEKQAGLLGASMMAAVSVGIHPSLAQAGKTMTRVERVYTANPDAAYDRKYEQFIKRVGEAK